MHKIGSYGLEIRGVCSNWTKGAWSRHIEDHFPSQPGPSKWTQGPPMSFSKSNHLKTNRFVSRFQTTYSPPTLTGVSHQWTESTNIGCNQWLPLAKIALKVPHADRNRSLVARTSMHGECIKWHVFTITIDNFTMTPYPCGSYHKHTYIHTYTHPRTQEPSAYKAPCVRSVEFQVLKIAPPLTCFYMISWCLLLLLLFY